ncbi:hypothetical protein [Streptosporangium roseum]|uniref:hypothetical protein n=1 Tax=Streptosporangium roseum TaxID=2001 RepID=UPI0012DE9DD6|nr:hypothetical protein [Streptosporangium roseum]
MSRSLKITRVLLVAAFAAGLAACSGEGDPSAPPTAPAASASAAGSETVSTPTTPAASAESTSEAASSEPTAEEPGDGAGDTGPAMHLIGALSASPTQPGWITVQLDAGDAQPVMLSPEAVVLDLRGAICDKGAVPHKCTAAQLEKALKKSGVPYAKVTLKSGVAVRVEELVKE